MGLDNSLINVLDDGDIIVRDVSIAGSKQPIEITLSHGKVSEKKETDGPISLICLPPLVDIHMHANRAFSLGQVKPESFEHSIQLTTEIFKDFDAQRYCLHATKLFERAYSHGTTGIRTHADIDSLTGLKAVQGTLEARDIAGSRMDIEVVAFATVRMDPASKEGRRAIREAVDMGADLIGAAPNFYSDPRRSINAIIELAIELDVAVDLHLDEHLDVDKVCSEYLADATIENGYQDKVTLSHGCVLSALESKRRNAIINKLYEARICVVALPTTNLYLQDRHGCTPNQRGLTCVQELLNAGVRVRFASDNVRDAFFPYGDADLLETAYLALITSQIDLDENLIKSICAGRGDVSVGDPADIVLIVAGSLDEALSKRSTERILIRQGKLISNPTFS